MGWGSGQSVTDRRSLLAWTGGILAVGIAGCTDTPSADTTGTETPTRSTTIPDALDDTLVGLYQAENRTDYAATHDLMYADGRVDVVMVLTDGGNLPTGYDLTVTAHHDHLIQARARVSDLPALAQEDGVRYVRPPRTGTADGASGVSTDA